jgi:hypothetical protein
MKTAYVIEIRDKTFIVQDGDDKYQYDQGEGIESPPMIHADLLWFKGATKGREVKYEGERIPEVLVVRDGEVPGYHYYHQRTAA